MEAYEQQDSDLIYALDIGTRGVVGVVGRAEQGRFRVLDMELAEHGRRTMIDGQIDDIRQVGALARSVTDRLEERLKIRLERVCVAAAGRALRTEHGSFSLELTSSGGIGPEEISRLETGAVSVAEEHLQGEEDTRQQFFLVGYTVSQYRLDRYPLTSLLDHSGKLIEADVVATFLPGEVVESLYAAMRQAGLHVASLTLEPIAAMNAAIPQELRLLNLALVDIGAGTTDIAICRDGSVVGYTMATIAGDEITEGIMKAYLVDFQMAEKMKRQLSEGGEIQYRDVLGMEDSCTCEELQKLVKEPMENLAQAVSEQLLALNGGAPSAVFLAGGGSQLNGLRECVAERLGMDLRRVSTAGSNYEKTVFSKEFELESPEYATPLGIALSAGLGLLNDSYMVMLNGKVAKLFRSGALTLRDVLLMNGYTYSDMLARSGKSISVLADGQRITLRGGTGTPAVLRLNGEESPITHVVCAGDQVEFIPAVPGKDAAATVGDVIQTTDRMIFLNDLEVDRTAELHQGDVIVTMKRRSTNPQPELVAVETKPTVAAPEETAETYRRPAEESHLLKRATPAPPPRKPIKVELNGEMLYLPGKEGGQPYYLMDLLEKTGIDFDHLDRPVRMEVNGSDGSFQQVLKDGDSVSICCDEMEKN